MEAEEDLGYSFEHCLPRYRQNKRVALMFLVPAKLMRGKLPKEALLDKYGLSEYEGIARAVRQGNPELFNGQFRKHEALFRRRGLYLLLERLKWLVYRTLFKRAYNMVHAANTPSVCSLDIFQCALRAAKVDMSAEEVECIVANLIHLKFVRGYMAIQKDKTFVILSAKDPFPNISAVI